MPLLFSPFPPRPLEPYAAKVRHCSARLILRTPRITETKTKSEKTSASTWLLHCSLNLLRASGTLSATQFPTINCNKFNTCLFFSLMFCPVTICFFIFNCLKIFWNPKNGSWGKYFLDFLLLVPDFDAETWMNTSRRDFVLDFEIWFLVWKSKLPGLCCC